MIRRNVDKDKTFEGDMAMPQKRTARTKAKKTMTTSNVPSLHQLIFQHRRDMRLTQAQYGKRFDVSGPAIFKFEQGAVTPSFKLWMKIAADMDIGEQASVTLWAKAKIPPSHRDLLCGGKTGISEAELMKKTGLKKVPYSRLTNRDKLREAALADNMLPKGLQSLLRDNEIWQIYKPTGREIDQLTDFFGRFGEGAKRHYIEALRLLREFAQSDE